jgi:U3 small nucleolar RNA-associated protein 22
MESAALLLVYLLRTNKMNPCMTPIQLFTVVLQTWATTNWLGDEQKTEDSSSTTFRAAHSQAKQFQGSSTNQQQKRRTVLVLPLEDSNEKETIHQSELAHLYYQQTKDSPITKEDPPTLIEAYASIKSYTLGPVFLDPTMTYNYLGDVSPNCMTVLQSHARKSLEGLKNNSRSAFRFLFMQPARFWSQWDLYVQIPMAKKKDDDDDIDSEEWEFSTRRLLQTLESALGNRIHGMRVLSTGNGETGAGKSSSESDQSPCQAVGKKGPPKRPLAQSPIGTNNIVLGISINAETSQRVVDRGPPSDNHKEVKEFIKLWGKKSQLRRFKDGAIVQAVVWNENIDEKEFSNADKLQGGFVEKIVRHIVQLHCNKEPLQVSLPNLLSVVDEVVCKDKSMTPFVDPLSAHQSIMKTFDSLSNFLRKGSQPPPAGTLGTSRLGLPFTIDAVEPLSSSLRYSELFPPIPHPFLGGVAPSSKKVAGAIVSDPILIQVRFGSSSKWPTDLKAIGAAKTAMLIQLANGIETSGKKGLTGAQSLSLLPIRGRGVQLLSNFCSSRS